MRNYILSLFFFLASLNFAEAKEPITNYEVFFSPHDHVAEELIAFIGKEKKSIKAAVYCLMHRGIAKALLQAHNAGVKVEIIVDPFSIKAKSPVKKMAEANLPIYVWSPQLPVKFKNGRTPRRHKQLMHDKFCILGDNRVWTGSFNFTFDAATNNQENVIVLENEEIAKKYLNEFERLKKAGCVPYQDFVATNKTSHFS